jgi:hypothetical protein
MKFAAIKSIAIGLMIAGTVPSAASASETGSQVVPFEDLCSAENRSDSEICSFLGNADQVFGFEEKASLTGDPSSYIIVARYDDDWSIYSRGVHRHPSNDAEGSWTTETRKSARKIPSSIAERFYASQAFRAKGAPDNSDKPAVICNDGSVLNLALKGSKMQVGSDPEVVVRRFTCATPTQFSTVKLDLMRLAVEYDPQLAQFFPGAVSNLSGLQGEPSD